MDPATKKCLRLCLIGNASLQHTCSRSIATMEPNKGPQGDPALPDTTGLEVGPRSEVVRLGASRKRTTPRTTRSGTASRKRPGHVLAITLNSTAIATGGLSDVAALLTKAFGHKRARNPHMGVPPRIDWAVGHLHHILICWVYRSKPRCTVASC